MNDLHVIIKILVGFWIVVSLIAGAYVLSTCGPKALLLGNGALPAALMGMCEE